MSRRRYASLFVRVAVVCAFVSFAATAQSAPVERTFKKSKADVAAAVKEPAPVGVRAITIAGWICGRGG